MSYKRNVKRSLNDIGKSEYDFDYKKEKLIYKYVCRRRLKRKQIKKLKENQRFDSYLKWKQSIFDKYKNYTNDNLINFSRYLNQKIRMIKPNKETLLIYISVCLTLLFTKLFDIFVDTKIDFTGYSIWTIIIFIFICIVFNSAIMFFIFWNLTTPVFNETIEENLLIDYKEIIDEILNSKSK